MEPGYLYVLWNPVYEKYGDNVYKIGKTKNLPKRKNGYITPYIDDSVYKYTSPLFNDMESAEKIIFALLKKYRIKKNREFFGCDLEIIKAQMNKIISLFDDEKSKEDSIKIKTKINLVIMNLTDKDKETGLIKIDSEKTPGIDQMKTTPIKEIKVDDKTINFQSVTIINPTNLVSNNSQTQSNKDTQIQCPYCEKTFSKKFNLTKHIKLNQCKNNPKNNPKNEQLNESSKRPVCLRCGASFCKNYGLKRHVKENRCKKINQATMDKIKELEKTIAQLKINKIT